VWHFAQATDTWAPASGKALDAWLNIAGLNEVVVWQLVQVAERPVWLMTAGVGWHAAQVLGVPM
jgi:hypothetical protein